MAEIASAFVTIAPSAKGFGSSLNSQVGGQVKSSGTSLGKTFGKLFALSAGVIAAAGIGNFLKGSVEEAREAQKVGAATEQIIKSTGGAAKISAKQVGDLASAISLKSGIDDEAIQSGQNLLLTFKNVRNEVGGKFTGVFNRASYAAADLSAAGFGSIESASKMLGKALNDPVKGITALSRAGVTFTDQQKEQIKTMVESGDTVSAQKMILSELESQVGGVAAATATSGDKAKVAFDNIKESVGTALLPVIDTLERQFLKLVPAIQRGIGGIGPLVQKARAFLQPFVASIATTVANLATQLGPVLANLAAAVGTFVGQMQSGTGAGGAFASILGSIASVLGSVFGFISNNQAVVGTFVGIILAAAAAAKIFAAAQVLVNLALSANPIGIVVIAIAALAAGLVYAYKHSETFRAIVDGAFKGIQKVVSAVIGFVVPFVKKHWQLLVTIIGGPLGIVVGLVVKHFGTIKQFAGDAANFVVNSAKKYIEFQNKVGEVVGKVLKFFRDLPGKIKGFFANLPSELAKIGGQLIDGLVRGLTAAGHRVTDYVQSLINKIPKKIRSLMGIASPSKVTTKLGEQIGDGLRVGLERSAAGAGKAADKVAKKIKERISKLRDDLTSARSDFAALVDPIAANFTSGLFDFDNAGAFTANLNTVKGTLTTLLGNFKTLIGEGLSPGFLYKLFESGGPGLINSLAALPKADAVAAGALFGEVTSLSDQLGSAVARSTDKGAGLETQTVRLEKKLDKLIKHVDKNAETITVGVNGAAGAGHRRGKRFGPS